MRLRTTQCSVKAEEKNTHGSELRTGKSQAKKQTNEQTAIGHTGKRSQESENARYTNKIIISKAAETLRHKSKWKTIKFRCQ